MLPGFKIAVDDAGAMRGGERVGDLHRVGQRLAERQLAAPQPRRQRLAVEELHHQEVDAVLVADIEQRADVGMRQGRHGARLAIEALARRRVRDQIVRQDFDRDSPIETRVARLVDFAHAAGAERGDDLVGPEARARLERRRASAIEPDAGSLPGSVSNVDPTRASAASSRSTSRRRPSLAPHAAREKRGALLRRQAGGSIEDVAQVGGIDHDSVE